MHRSMTLKQRITLGLAAFLLALAVQIFLSFYQSGTVMQRLDDQMGQFNAISRFQGGVERGLTVLGDYRWERSRMQQLRSQIDPHFLFNTLNVIQQTASTEKGYRTQALIMALSHLLRYSLMSNDEQVPLAREVRIVDEYYSIYHVRFGGRVRMRWCISDSLDLTETMVPSFILQPLVEIVEEEFEDDTPADRR